MNVAIGREADRLTKGLSFLATVGSIAPFVGLFGTVWGIKHAFEEIALQQSTNLAVVAPGIAEALLATGLGPPRRDPGGDLLQQAHPGQRRGDRRLRGLRRRVRA